MKSNLLPCSTWLHHRRLVLLFGLLAAAGCLNAQSGSGGSGPAIAAGGSHSIYLDSNGIVWAAGSNQHGQLGNGATENSSTPAQGMTGVKAVAAGDNHTLFLKNDGSVWTSGDNEYGQLGDGTFIDRSTPVYVTDNVLAVAAGGRHSLFLKNDGTVWAVGNNSYGQFGNGSLAIQSPTPVQVTDGTRAIAAGWGHSLFLKSDGTVWATGDNQFGQLGDETFINRSTPVKVSEDALAVAAGGQHSLVLKTDGSVLATGSNASGQFGNETTISRSKPVPVMSEVQAVAAGNSHSLFLKRDGSVLAAGYNLYGQLGDGTTGNRSTPVPVQVVSNVQAVAAGGQHSLFLKSDGSVWAVGNTALGQLGDGTMRNRSTPVQVMASVQSVAAGEKHTLFLKTDGTAWAAGENSFGRLGDGTTINRSTPVQVMNSVQAVAAGTDHSLFLKTDGTVWAAGSNGNGQLGHATSSDRPTPVQVNDGVQAVAAGSRHSFFLKNDGTLWAAGYNGFGQLGDGTTTGRYEPVQVMSGVLAVTAGYNHSLFLKSDGTLLGAGLDDWSQLSGGTPSYHATPIQVDSDIRAMAAGYNHSLFLKYNGTVWAVGENRFGELGDGTVITRWSPVPGMSGMAAMSAGSGHSLFLKSDSTLWAAGHNSVFGQLGDGSTSNRSTPVQVMSGVRTMAAGKNHSLFVKNDGTAWAAGDDYYGQLGDGTTTAPRTTPVHFLVEGMPVITAQPIDRDITTGQSTTFSVVTANGPLSFRWQRLPSGGATWADLMEGGAYSGTASAALVVTHATRSMNGDSFRCVVSNGKNTTSLPAILTVALTPVALTLGNLTATYDGGSKSATATTSPAGVPVTLTYNGSSTEPINAGSYTVVATVNHPDYSGDATGTLVIAKAPASVTLGSLTATYDGTPKAATATTSPAGVPTTITYNGNATAPINAGGYTVVATVSHPNYSGEATGTLVIAKAPASVTLGNLTATYDGTPKPATAATSPAGVPRTITYNGSATAPTNAGSYTVVATVSHPNYSGEVTGTLVIAKAPASVTLSNLTATYDGTPKPATAATSPAGVPTTITYNGSATAPTNAGSYTVVATVNHPDYSGEASSTLVVAKAPASVILSNLTATYDGTPKAATAATSPAGIPVTITYSGSTTPPTNTGSYTVVATIAAANHEGSGEGSLIIEKAIASASITGTVQDYDGTPKYVGVTTSPTGQLTNVTTTYAGSATAPSAIGTYAVSVDASGPNHTWSGTGTLTIRPTLTAGQGATVPSTAGNATVLSVDASTGQTPTSFRWQRQDDHGAWIDIPGATGSSYTIPSTQLYHNGNYRVIVNAGGVSTTSDPFNVHVTPAPASDARLLNLSTRALCQTGDSVLIPGFYIHGSGTKRMLMRAVGPELTRFDLDPETVLPDPQMVLRRQSDNTVVASNDNWNDNANWQDIRDTTSALHAFALTVGSKSAALLMDLPAGGYTITSSGHDAETGVSIVELYEANGDAEAARLINISNRGFVGVGGNIMIPGFVASADGARTFLVRAVGPTLSTAPFNVTGTLTDPILRIFNSKGDNILTSDNWGENGDAAQVRATASAVSAFGLREGSKDAAFVVTLPPGGYTVQASGKDGATGVALVEVYLVP